MEGANQDRAQGAPWDEPAAGTARFRGAGMHVVVILLVCILHFFLHQGRFDFIETEGLRAIVPYEMLERGGPSMPTVHHRPYVNKPPLYAWTTTLLAQAMGRFDEQVARLPSSISATVLVLLLYIMGRRWGGAATGLCAAAFALTNLTWLDYGFRAELDMPFTLLLTGAILLLWPALTRRGAGSVAAWLGAYALATAAAMWKAPHSLIFMGLGLLAYAKVKRSWRWMVHPGNLMGAALSLGALSLWLTRVLGYAGGKRVGTAAGSEVVNRLAPGLGDLLAIPLFPLILAAVTLPASLFMVASFWETSAAKKMAAGSAWARLRSRLAAWWSWAARDPFTEFLLLMLLPNLVFLAVAPAKSARYTLPMFPLLMLVCGRIAAGQPHACPATPETSAPSPLDRAAAALIAAFKGVAVAGFVLALLAMIAPRAWEQRYSPGPAWAWLAFGAGGLGAWRLARLRWDGLGAACGTSLLLISAGFAPVLSEVWWPARVRSDTQREAGARIDAVVPEGEPVIVLGRQEFPDTAFYSHRPFHWFEDSAQARAVTSSPAPFFLMRETELMGDKPGMKNHKEAPGYRERLRFDRIDRDVILFNMEIGP